ncbi:MAG: DEAD/DEAH box helicase [Candidatus Gracilibacteria bacterium]|nr:DEAD/DEAH box helicase [Candidatus Gracilibacteria bacterium]
MNFLELNIIPPILKALDKLGFTTPTEIQEKVIPLAIKGKDILGCAQTGSGKTFAFALPILHTLYNRRLEEGLVEGKIKRKIKALIIAPTRELAIQIGDTFAPYCTNTNFKHTVIYGGVNQFHQVKAIEKGVDILVATPGRLEDLISQGIIKLSYVEILVLDEADRMLDLGFLGDIKKVMKRIPKERQTLFFSATMPTAIKELASSLLHCPEVITVHKVASTTSTIKQQVYHVKASHRRQLLQHLVKKSEYDSILVFVKTKDDTEYVMEYISSAHIKCDNIHRNRSQNARQRALKSLKDGDIKVLVATDIASRGLDVNDLSCVINYNVPGDPETYVHRIGRTARAGKKGVSITFCIDQDKENLANIEKLIGKKLEVVTDESYKNEEIPKGKILGYANFEEGFKKDKIKNKARTAKKRHYK